MNWTRIERGAAYRIPGSLQSIPGMYGRYQRPADDQPATSGLYLAQLFDTLRRRRRLILTFAICGTLSAAAFGLLVAPKYTATAQIIVQSNRDASASQSSAASDESAVDTQVKILSSNDYLQRVVDSLLNDPEFVATKRPASQTEKMAEVKPVKHATTGTETSGIAELNRRLHIWIGTFFRDRHGAILDLEDLQRHLKIAQEGRSRVITVRYTSPNPEEAAMVANRAVQLYADGQNDQQSKYTSRELAQLRERIDEARNEVVQNTAAVQKAAQARTQPAQNQGGDDARDSGSRLRELERGAAASALVYSKLQRREKELLAQRDGPQSDIRILSLASPPDRPSSHNPVLFILPALIICLIGGSFFAVIADQSDRGLRSERDVADALGLHCIGLVPQLPRLGDMKPHQYMLTQPFSAYTESIRSVVGEIWLTMQQRPPKTLLVSSSVPGEGKTTAAISIAVCAAMLGRRTLLIDLDFKRPSIARELGGNADKGIFDILLRDFPPADVIIRIPDLGLDYLPMSACPTDALPLLASDKVPLLLRQLCENYDSIVIDGPPLLVISESRLLPPMADKVLFVVKWGTTRREVAQNAISLLRDPDGLIEKHADMPIALLSQVDLKTHSTYRYGDVGEALVKYQDYYSRSSRF